MPSRIPAIHAAIDCLRRLSEAFSERRAHLAQAVGLTEHQWDVLEEISTEHFMPSMFAKHRDSSRAAVSKTLRQLLDKGLILASIDKQDARQRRYVLTAKGKRTMQQLREHRQRAIEAIWLNLEPEDVERFTAFGNQLSEHLEQYVRRQEGKHSEEEHGKDSVRKSL